MVATVVLKNDERFQAKFDSDEEWNAAAFTEATVYRFELVNGDAVVVSGQYISHIYIKKGDRPQ